MRSAKRWAAVMMTAGAVVTAGGCAHQERAAEQAAAGTIPAKDTSEQPARRTVVTGSRVPQYAKNVCGGVSTGIDNVRVYCRDQLRTTGRDGDTGVALRSLDPSLGGP